MKIAHNARAVLHAERPGRMRAQEWLRQMLSTIEDGGEPEAVKAQAHRAVYMATVSCTAQDALSVRDAARAIYAAIDLVE
jgi:hypothetical protein